MKVPTREETVGKPEAIMWDTPAHWPRDVYRMPMKQNANLGIKNGTSELYWDGDALVTEKRWGTVERRIAIIGLVVAIVGVAATVVQAWAAVVALSVP